mmetsp:Transcript_2931/g.6671  ORF Transcript_2931/g.6671 Transcript_2931/m.6671 type:complete len:94 (+) Transcript_2931:61-342(+)
MDGWMESVLMLYITTASQRATQLALVYMFVRVCMRVVAHRTIASSPRAERRMTCHWCGGVICLSFDPVATWNSSEYGSTCTGLMLFSPGGMRQ